MSAGRKAYSGKKKIKPLVGDEVEVEVLEESEKDRYHRRDSSAQKRADSSGGRKH